MARNRGRRCLRLCRGLRRVPRYFEWQTRRAAGDCARSRFAQRVMEAIYRGAKRKGWVKLAVGSCSSSLPGHLAPGRDLGLRVTGTELTELKIEK